MKRAPLKKRTLFRLKWYPAKPMGTKSTTHAATAPNCAPIIGESQPLTPPICGGLEHGVTRGAMLGGVMKAALGSVGVIGGE